MYLTLERYRHQMIILLPGGNFSFQLMLGLFLDFTVYEHCSASLYLCSEKIRLTWVIVIYGNLDWLPLNYYLWFWSFMVIFSEFYQVFVIIYFPTWYSFVALLTQYSDPTQSLSSDLSTRDPAHHPLQRVLHGHIFHIQLSNSVFLSVLNGLISLFKVFS